MDYMAWTDYLCSAIWAPRSKGFCKYGLMNVLSTTSQLHKRLERNDMMDYKFGIFRYEMGIEIMTLIRS